MWAKIRKEEVWTASCHGEIRKQLWVKIRKEVWAKIRKCGQQVVL